jgi:hypothetical protein
MSANILKPKAAPEVSEPSIAPATKKLRLSHSWSQ